MAGTKGGRREAVKGWRKEMKYAQWKDEKERS